MNDMMYSHEHKILQQARDTYGSKNQILVCMEELNELACVLAKFPRYEDEAKATQELHDKALDEVADVLIILDHVQAILNLSDTEIRQRISAKIDRLQRWLSHSSSMVETVQDRAVSDHVCTANHTDCVGCKRDMTNALVLEQMCMPCCKVQATEGIAPFYAEEKDD